MEKTSIPALRKKREFTARLDEKVLLTMLAIGLLSVLVMAFRHRSQEPCNPFSFKPYSNANLVGNLIYFNADAKTARQWQWNFGDGTPASAQAGSLASHQYGKPGRYTVTLTINGTCARSQVVEVLPLVKSAPTRIARGDANAVASEPLVDWPREPIDVGSTLLITDDTKGAYAWSWYIGEGKTGVKFSDREVLYTFKSPGVTRISLQVNGDPRFSVTRNLRVVARRAAAASPPPLGGKSGGTVAPIPQIVWPREPIYAGQGAQFLDITSSPRINRWNWRIEDKTYDTRTVTHVFGKPGLKRVTVELNGNPRFSQTKDIEVVERASTMPVAPVAAQVEALLLRAVKKQAQAVSFDVYAADNDHRNVKVLYERNKRDVVEMTLEYAIDKLREERIRDLSVSLMVNPATNKVAVIHVKVRTKLLF